MVAEASTDFGINAPTATVAPVASKTPEMPWRLEMQPRGTMPPLKPFIVEKDGAMRLATEDEVRAVKSARASRVPESELPRIEYHREKVQSDMVPWIFCPDGMQRVATDEEVKIWEYVESLRAQLAALKASDESSYAALTANNPAFAGVGKGKGGKR